jgi:signal transduction histidine kinase
MHPFFSRPEQLAVYLGSWLGLALLASFAVSFPDDAFLRTALLIVPIALAFSFVSLSSWYLCRSLPLQGTPRFRLIVSLLAGSTIGGLILYGLTVGWSWIVIAPDAEIPQTLQTLPLLVFVTGFVLYLLAVVFHYLLIAFAFSRSAELRSLQSEIHARSSELKALRAQIDPHFLFNSLNSIAALIALDPEKARGMTVELADFFRSSVAAGRQDLVPISEELKLVQAYLNIEQARYGKRLGVSLQAPDSLQDVLVPPLLLQPLIENAIKHGISHLLEGGNISITVMSDAGRIRISVKNPSDPDRTQSSKGTGFGLASVKDRIRAVSSDQGSLTIERKTTTFEAIVSLPDDLQRHGNL